MRHCLSGILGFFPNERFRVRNPVAVKMESVKVPTRFGVFFLIPYFHRFKLQSVVNVMMNIIHEHIPNANLSTVLSDMNIQVPRIDSSTLNNSISGNELSSSRSHDNEGIVDKF
ncbi:hypothetical protein R6Q57_014903 [Mikania cordata]